MSRLNVSIDYVRLAQWVKAIIFCLDKIDKEKDLLIKFNCVGDIRFYLKKIKEELDNAVVNQEGEAKLKTFNQ